MEMSSVDKLLRMLKYSVRWDGLPPEVADHSTMEELG